MADHAKIVEGSPVVLGGFAVANGSAVPAFVTPASALSEDDVDDYAWVLAAESRFLHDPSGWSA